jgi:amino acid transporter
MQTADRDAGLVQSANRDLGLARVIGVVGLSASIFSMLVGAGIFVVPAQLAAAVGAAAPLAVLLCAVAVGAIGICLAESLSRVPSSGGLYAAVEEAFGPCAGYVGGTLFWVSNVMACAAVTSALGDAVASSLPHAIEPAARPAFIVAAVIAICAVNARGAKRGVRLVTAAALLKGAPLVVFLVVGIFWVKGGNLSWPSAFSAGGVGRALLLTLFTFQGFETALCASGEVRDPARTIPRALFLALLGVTLLYGAVQFVAQGVLGAALGGSKAPLADAMGGIHPSLRLLMLAGAVISMFGWITADLLSSPRILFAFSRDGLLPRFLGRLSVDGHAPYMAIWCYALVVIGLALSGSFAELAAPAALVLAALYIAVCAASWVLARRGVARAGKPLGFRGLGAAAALGSASMLALICLGSRGEILGLAALTLAALAVYLIQTRLIRGAATP